MFKKGHKGYITKQTSEHTEKIRLANLGKKRSEETRRKILASGTTFKKGMTPWNKGKKGYRAGLANNKWKGDKVGYVSMHLWVSRWKGKPCKCEMCGTDKAKKYEWANIDHKYRRVLEDYIRMCTKCHRKYDKGMGIKIN